MILVEHVFCVCGRVILHFNKLLEFGAIVLCKLTEKCDLPFDIKVWIFLALGWNVGSWSALDFSFFLLPCCFWGIFVNRKVPNHVAIVWEICNQEISIDCYRCCIFVAGVLDAWLSLNRRWYQQLLCGGFSERLIAPFFLSLCTLYTFIVLKSLLCAILNLLIQGELRTWCWFRKEMKSNGYAALISAYWSFHLCSGADTVPFIL